MSVPAAFIGVVLIWSTTPLAIKWSSQGVGFLFGVASRMLLGLFVCLVLIAVLSRRVRWHREALRTYLAGGLGIWGAMTGVYWGAQFIPSGLVSVLFGLTPLVTALMANLWLQEKVLTPMRILGMLLGLTGLAVIFAQNGEFGAHALLGMGAILLSVHIHSASSVWVKRIGATLHPLETVTGSLLIAVPLFVLNWWLAEGRMPATIPAQSLAAIVYLGVMGSVFGFMLYYYILRQVQTTRVALITLVSPVNALFLGLWLNGETISLRQTLGATLILMGLAAFQWGERWRRAIE